MSREAGYYLKTISERGTAGVVPATIVVAASDSLYPERADYVCDGVADHAQINAALAIGDVYLMPGTFHVSAPIQMKESFSNLSGAGHGWELGGTTLYLDDNSDCNMIEMLGTEHRVYFPTVHDLILEGNQANNASGNGIYCPVTTVNEVSDEMFYNLGIHDIKDDGMYIYGGWYVSLINVWCEVCGGVGAKLNVQSNVLNSVFSSNGGTGLELGGICSVSNSSVEQNVGHGIVVYDKYARICHNMIRGNSKDAAGVSHGIVSWSADDITIADNVILGSAVQGHGIYVGATTERIDIHDNNISGNVTAAITNDGTGNRVHHNIGFVTENSGTDTVTAATKAVTHGLAVTPAVGDIMITPVADIAPAARWWISGLTATQFTINLDQAPTNPAAFAWKAIVL